MNKLWVIIRREYSTRVRKRFFILSTFLVPLFLAALMVLPILANKLTEKEQYTVYVSDPSGKIATKLVSSDKIKYQVSTEDLKVLQEKTKGNEDIAVLVLPGDYSKQQLAATVYSSKALSAGTNKEIRDDVRKVVENLKMENAGISPEKLAETKLSLDLNTVKLSEEGEQKTNVGLALVASLVMALLIYFLLVMYGTIVMRGVLEEKTSRIVEVIVSSVKPLQLMFGKIIGIGAVGLTQFILWNVLLFAIMLVMGIVGLGTAGPAEGEAMQVSAQQMSSADKAQAMKIAEAMSQFSPSLIIYFLIYFAGGYLIYGSIIAALASAADEEADGQQLVSLTWYPLLVPMLLLSPIVQNPNGALAFWGSMIPLWSPVVMMARLVATDVPFWQVALSISLMVITVIAVAWFAGRIYRVGIFMYGQKPKLGTILKWVFSKQ